MSEKRFRAEYIRYALMRIPQEELQKAERVLDTETGRTRIDARPGKDALSVLERTPEGWIVRFPYRQLKRLYRRRIRVVNETWFAAEKEELSRYLPKGVKYDRFVGLVGVAQILSPKGRIRRDVWRRITGELLLRLPRDSNGKVLVPRELYIVADPNPAGRFLAESLGLSVRALSEQAGSNTQVIVAVPDGDVEELRAEDYGVEAKKFVAATLFNQVYNRVAAVLAKAVDAMGIFPKKRSILKRLRELTGRASGSDLEALREIIRRVEADEDVGEDLLGRIDDRKLRAEVRRVLNTRFLLTDVGRVALLTLALLDDLEHETTLVLRVPELGGEFRVPVNAWILLDDVRRISVRLRAVPEERSDAMHRAVSHDEAVRWLVSRGLSTDDAEQVLERLWLRGYISYPRNAGTGIRDVDAVARALGEMSMSIDESQVERGDEPGLYPLRVWDDLGGVEREFMDWLARRIADRTVPVTIEVEVKRGRERLDYRRWRAVMPVAGAVDGVYVPVGVERGEDGVSLERLVEVAQELGVGTEATRSDVLRRLQELGLISIGERVRLTHNGRILAVLAKAAFPDATDADRVRVVLEEVEERVAAGEPVDKALGDAVRKIVRRPEKFAKAAAERLHGLAVGEEKTTKQFGFVDRVVLYAYLMYLTRGRWPTRRDIARAFIRGGKYDPERFGLLDGSEYFVVVRGKREDSVVYRLSEDGIARAKRLLELAGEGKHITDVYEHLGKQKS